MGNVSDRVSQTFDTFNRQRVELEQEIESLKHQLQIKEVHAEDKLHRLRASILKRLRPELRRMEDLLTANSRTPSKTHIVDAYGKDVLEAISDIVVQMEKGNKPENCIKPSTQ